MKVILSRTDAIGDVVLSLPVAGYLKALLPEVQIWFIGKAYTRPIIEVAKAVDFFLDEQELTAKSLEAIQAEVIIFLLPNKRLAKMSWLAGIPLRIGTSHRMFHWFWLNRLVHFSRKKSLLHESQLNFKLLEPLRIKEKLGLDQIQTLYFPNAVPLPDIADLSRPYVILHPKSSGSAREWPLVRYKELVSLLQTQGYTVVITGTQAEGDLIKKIDAEFLELNGLIDLTGRLTLEALIGLIAYSDGIIACSTGPLHIGAMMGVKAIGLYVSWRPMHAGRWAPVGQLASHISAKPICKKVCNKGQFCACLDAVQPKEVLAAYVAIGNRDESTSSIA